MKYTLGTILKCLDEPSDEMDKLSCLTEQIEGFKKELPNKMNRLKRIVLDWRVTTWKSDMDKPLGKAIAKWNEEEILGA